MNGQHLRALPVEELAPMVGSALVEADVCKEASGDFATAAASLVQGSLELVNDAVSQTRDVLEYKVPSVNEIVPSNISPCFSLDLEMKKCT